ncbi:unnamed protein product [Amoebophrya sp. A25]|nr:unnamed protein product [Amoebophrya sp. A25]|eukprot:GSA25T00018679001.1
MPASPNPSQPTLTLPRLLGHEDDHRSGKSFVDFGDRSGSSCKGDGRSNYKKDRSVFYDVQNPKSIFLPSVGSKERPQFLQQSNVSYVFNAASECDIPTGSYDATDAVVGGVETHNADVGVPAGRIAGNKETGTITTMLNSSVTMAHASGMSQQSSSCSSSLSSGNAPALLTQLQKPASSSHVLTKQVRKLSDALPLLPGLPRGAVPASTNNLLLNGPAAAEQDPLHAHQTDESTSMARPRTSTSIGGKDLTSFRPMSEQTFRRCAMQGEREIRRVHRSLQRFNPMKVINGIRRPSRFDYCAYTGRRKSSVASSAAAFAIGGSSSKILASNVGSASTSRSSSIATGMPGDPSAAFAGRTGSPFHLPTLLAALGNNATAATGSTYERPFFRKMNLAPRGFVLELERKKRENDRTIMRKREEGMQAAVAAAALRAPTCMSSASTRPGGFASSKIGISIGPLSRQNNISGTPRQLQGDASTADSSPMNASPARQLARRAELEAAKKRHALAKLGVESEDAYNTQPLTYLDAFGLVSPTGLPYSVYGTFGSRKESVKQQSPRALVAASSPVKRKLLQEFVEARDKRALLLSRMEKNTKAKETPMERTRDRRRGVHLQLGARGEDSSKLRCVGQADLTRMAMLDLFERGGQDQDDYEFADEHLQILRRKEEGSEDDTEKVREEAQRSWFLFFCVAQFCYFLRNRRQIRDKIKKVVGAHVVHAATGSSGADKIFDFFSDVRVLLAAQRKRDMEEQGDAAVVTFEDGVENDTSRVTKKNLGSRKSARSKASWSTSAGRRDSERGNSRRRSPPNEASSKGTRRRASSDRRERQTVVQKDDARFGFVVTQTVEHSQSDDRDKKSRTKTTSTIILQNKKLVSKNGGGSLLGDSSNKRHSRNSTSLPSGDTSTTDANQPGDDAEQQPPRAHTLEVLLRKNQDWSEHQTLSSSGAVGKDAVALLVDSEGCPNRDHIKELLVPEAKLCFFPLRVFVLASDSEIHRLRSAHDYIACKLLVRLRRRRARIMFETMRNWSRGGNTILAFKKFHRGCRLIQTWWRNCRAHMKKTHEKCAKIWLQIERAHVRERIMRVDSGGVAEAIQLPLNERISLALLPDSVRSGFISAELRAMRYYLLPELYDWVRKAKIYEEDLGRWREDRLAVELLCCHFDVPPPEVVPFPSLKVTVQMVKEWLFRCLKEGSEAATKCEPNSLLGLVESRPDSVESARGVFSYKKFHDVEEVLACPLTTMDCCNDDSPAEGASARNSVSQRQLSVHLQKKIREKKMRVSREAGSMLC